MTDTRTLIAVMVLALLAGASWWIGRNVAPLTAVSDPRARHDPDYVIQNFSSTVMNEHGRKKYVLTANRLVHYPDDDTAHLEHPYLIQYPEGGVAVHAVADTGIVPGDADEIYMQGRVRVTRGADTRVAGGVITADTMRIELDK